MCQDLVAPTNGDVSFNVSHGGTVTYTCDDGFELIGDSMGVCWDGVWSISEPTCCKLHTYIYVHIMVYVHVRKCSNNYWSAVGTPLGWRNFKMVTCM